MPGKTAALARRQLLRLLGWAVLPAAAIALTGCAAPQYDPERGVFVLRPKK